MIPGIYQIRNIIDQKRYIGSSPKCVHRRTKKQIRDLQYNRHGNNGLQTAWNLYSQENFAVEILEVLVDIDHLSKKELAKFAESREQFYISQFNKYQLYNIQLIVGGSRFGSAMPSSAKLAISKHFKGRQISEEHRQLIREANQGQGFGRKLSPETCTKMSASRIGRKPSISHRQAMSAGRMEMKFSTRHKANLSAAHSRFIWITDGFTSKKFRKDLLIPEGWKRGRVLRKQ